MLTQPQKNQLISAMTNKGVSPINALNEANGPRADELYKEYCLSFENRVRNFFNQWNNRRADFDNVYGNQCVDVFKYFNRDVVGGPAVKGNAIDYWNNYPKTHYTRIVNTITAIPKIGDVAIFEVSKLLPLGHIAVVNWANLFILNLFEQNWPVQGYYDRKGNFIGTGKCHFRNHNYLSPKIKGWLHPIKSL